MKTNNDVSSPVEQNKFSCALKKIKSALMTEYF
jgi:hypothetical protein